METSLNTGTRNSLLLLFILCVCVCVCAILILHVFHPRNICIWDTLLPARSNIVNGWCTGGLPVSNSLPLLCLEFMCHEGGASAIVYSNSTQRLVTGGKKGEICIHSHTHTHTLNKAKLCTSMIVAVQLLHPNCVSVIIDLRLQKIVTRVNAHATGVNTIVINDTENYFVSGSADGDIKVLQIHLAFLLVHFFCFSPRSGTFSLFMNSPRLLASMHAHVSFVPKEEC